MQTEKYDRQVADQLEFLRKNGLTVRIRRNGQITFHRKVEPKPRKS